MKRFTRPWLRSLLVGCLLPAAIRAAEPTVIPLWPNGAPGFESRKDEPEQAQDYWIRNIHHPSITAFLPPPWSPSEAGRSGWRTG